MQAVEPATEKPVLSRHMDYALVPQNNLLNKY
jgi:hypothetical protein